MKTAKEIVDLINAAKICTPHNVDDVIDMKGVTEVATLDEDEHRWYINATKVFKVGDEFFGVHGPVTLKSEEMGFSDVGFDCDAFEMEAAQSVTYKPKS